MWEAIFKGVGAFKGIGESKRNAMMLEMQGKVAEQQAHQDSQAVAREYRQLAGRQAAAIAQNGGAYEGSNAKVLHDTETRAFLDQLLIRYKGRMARIGMQQEGKDMMRRSANLNGAQMAEAGYGMWSSFQTAS